MIENRFFKVLEAGDIECIYNDFVEGKIDIYDTEQIDTVITPFGKVEIHQSDYLVECTNHKVIKLEKLDNGRYIIVVNNKFEKIPTLVKKFLINHEIARFMDILMNNKDIINYKIEERKNSVRRNNVLREIVEYDIYACDKLGLHKTLLALDAIYRFLKKSDMDYYDYQEYKLRYETLKRLSIKNII